MAEFSGTDASERSERHPQIDASERPTDASLSRLIETLGWHRDPVPWPASTYRRRVSWLFRAFPTAAATIPTQMHHVLQRLNPKFHVQSEPKELSEAEVEDRRSRSMTGDQGSAEWLSRRYRYLTASTVGVALGIDGPAARTNLLLEKVLGESNFRGGAATQWGHRYEPLIDLIYEFRHPRVTVHHLNLVEHKTVKYLGASTDGLASNGINMEIKCPPSRTISGKIPKEYWNQMQTQMEVLEVDLTHFIEGKFEEHVLHGNPEAPGSFWNRDHPHEWSIWVEWWNPTQQQLEYTYGKVQGPGVPTGAQRTELLNYEPPTPEAVEIRVMGWTMEQLSIQEVARDPQWFPTVRPILDQFWREVEYYRAHPRQTSELVRKISEERQRNRELRFSRRMEKQHHAKSMTPVRKHASGTASAEFMEEGKAILAKGRGRGFMGFIKTL